MAKHQPDNAKRAQALTPRKFNRALAALLEPLPKFGKTLTTKGQTKSQPTSRP